MWGAKCPVLITVMKIVVYDAGGAIREQDA